MTKQTILTGLRTNAEYHLGNYLGALMPMIHVAQSKGGEYRVNLFAPDLHSFTTPIDHTAFQAQTIDNLRLFVACGIPMDDESVFVYRQSRIPAHSELTWILSNFTGFGEMSRMVEFKSKAHRLTKDFLDSKESDVLVAVDEHDDNATIAEKQLDKSSQRVSIGLFTYPILMAADILLYDAQWVPVGEDQRQHLEFTRDIAQRFNNQFGETFALPKTVAEQQTFFGRDSAPRIRSLKDPSKKMSKSISDPAGTIQLSDSPKLATKKIMSATTDSIGTINFDSTNQPGITNLLTILALMSGRSQQDVNSEWTGNERYGDLKTAVAEVVSATLADIQTRKNAVNTDHMIAKIEADEAALTSVANDKLKAVQKAIGLI